MLVMAFCDFALCIIHACCCRDDMDPSYLEKPKGWSANLLGMFMSAHSFTSDMQCFLMLLFCQHPLRTHTRPGSDVKGS